MPTLSYLEMDAWSSDHVSCESEHRFIVELLNTRSYEPRGSKKYDLLSAKIRVQLKQFEASVRTLRHKLEDEFNFLLSTEAVACLLYLLALFYLLVMFKRWRLFVNE